MNAFQKAVLVLLLSQSLQAFAGVPGWSRVLSRASNTDLAIAGDSLPGGGGGNGAGILAFPVAISNASWGVLRVRNFSLGGAKWTNMIDQITGDQITSALAVNPEYLLIVCGRNNLLDGFITNQVVVQSWSLIESNLNIVASRCALQGTKLIIGEVLPAYGPDFEEWSIPGIRDLNTAYAGWCVTNSYAANTTFLPEHDLFSVINDGTGQLDSLHPSWFLSLADKLHLNASAYPFWGRYFVSYMGQFFRDPALTFSGRVVTRVVVTP